MKEYGPPLSPRHGPLSFPFPHSICLISQGVRVYLGSVVAWTSLRQSVTIDNMLKIEPGSSLQPTRLSFSNLHH